MLYISSLVMTISQQHDFAAVTNQKVRGQSSNLSKVRGQSSNLRFSWARGDPLARGRGLAFCTRRFRPSSSIRSAFLSSTKKMGHYREPRLYAPGHHADARRIPLMLFAVMPSAGLVCVRPRSRSRPSSSETEGGSREERDRLPKGARRVRAAASINNGGCWVGEPIPFVERRELKVER